METDFLIQDLTTIVVTASLVSIVFAILRWPSILGYLLSGIIVGPYTTSNLVIHDQASIHSISELGVIFLMFCIGLEFDLKKLKQTLFPSVLAMFLQAVTSFFLGALVANLLGWNPLLGTFLGAIFSISSSMVAIPILKNKNALKQPFAQFTIGVAVLEDIFAVVLLVVLSNLRHGQFNFVDCFNLIFWITVFIASMLIFGRLMAQRFIGLLKKIPHEEIIHVCVVGLILLLSEMSKGYSTALGAFLAGAIFSNTTVIHRLESMIAPIRDVFTAVFFVSIGMLIDPKLLWQYRWLICLLTVVVIIGQFCSVWFGFFLSGQKPSVAFRASLPKSQIGEFSFVIAALAKNLRIDDGQLMAITVGTSLFTIIAVNVLCAKEEVLLRCCERMIPHVFVSLCNVYQSILISIQNHLSGSRFVNIVKKPMIKIAIHFCLINAIVWCNNWLCGFLLVHPIPRTEPYLIWIQRGLSMLALCLALPFMTSVVRNLNLIFLTVCKSTLRGLFVNLTKHAALYQIFQLFVATIAIFVFTWLFLISSAKYLPTYMPVILLSFIGIILSFAFFKRIRNLNSQFEIKFLESFSNELEQENEKRRQAMIKVVSKRHPQEVLSRQVVLAPSSKFVGQTLKDCHLREQTKVTLLGIGREGFFCDTIPPDYIFFPGDALLLLGTFSQLDAAERLLVQARTVPINNSAEFDFDQIVITDKHPFLNETLASANIRNRFGVNVLSIQRKKQRLDQLTPTDIFKNGDCVFVVGHPNNIQRLKTLEVTPTS